MKKIVALVVIVFAMTAGTVTQATVLDKIVMYIPNRIVDVTDIISLSLGFGPCARAEMWCTRPFSFGAGTGVEAKMIKGYNRQYGFGLESGWDTSFVMISAEGKELQSTIGTVKTVEYYASGVPDLRKKDYSYSEGSRDYWSVGVQAGCGIAEVDAEFHAIELFDFFAGFIFFDLKDDDITMNDLSN
ncbi:MAG TPA: hypothetical protein DCZ94_15430 [Lentisphaeria bacterium]|nr:MAG: hypothetical protein A2X48_17185 [Lentisphaerae bacterium GWF2_49_21]HBC88342.1 hypothetical protein [Lentisphaeria bacterium]